MRDVLGRGSMLGYCTNVHAGPSLSATRDNLERYAVAVKAEVSPDAPMGVGLWLSRQATTELIGAGCVEGFAGWVADRGLIPFTLNGFPYDDFHQPVVKHRVYEPDWTTSDRLRYTLDLAEILVTLLGDELEGSISTLPLGWRSKIDGRAGAIDQAAANMRQVAERLARIEAETGKRIHLDIEPEPGCYVDTSSGVVKLFEDHLLRQGDERTIRRHLRVCHDICHTAVMFEDQAAALLNYSAAGIAVGKVQVSSALRVPFGELAGNARSTALERLSEFAEERYLHQTTVRNTDGSLVFFEDLPQALSRASESSIASGEWRVHFHVPLFLESIGPLGTTMGDTLELLALTEPAEEIRHFEAETYAWNVLPDGLKPTDLAGGIAEELHWLCRWKAAAKPA